uniref:SCP domain-containing protein n=1 Tax=Dicentrarchus labrax TaxID=13489 RepID=A0A8P4GE29_DICLA
KLQWLLHHPHPLQPHHLPHHCQLQPHPLPHHRQLQPHHLLPHHLPHHCQLQPHPLQPHPLPHHRQLQPHHLPHHRQLQPHHLPHHRQLQPHPLQPHPLQPHPLPHHRQLQPHHLPHHHQLPHHQQLNIHKLLQRNTWDEGLAITARAWARHCLFEHNTFLNDVRRVHPTFSSVGENIWTGYPPSSFDVAHSIKRWVDEKQDYDYDSDSCTKVCGHYTQVVWARSYKVGCAAQLCPNGVKNTEFGSRESVIFVCNYAPAGNVARKKPYETKGTECSGCEGKCESRLCRSQERDSQKSYNWSPDWDPAVAVSGSNYVSILIARPIALIFTFITAYVVHHFYPDVFCYE